MMETSRRPTSLLHFSTWYYTIWLLENQIDKKDMKILEMIIVYLLSLLINPIVFICTILVGEIIQKKNLGSHLMNYPLSLFHIEDDIFDEEECESIINQIEHGRNSGRKPIDVTKHRCGIYPYAI